ncbi:uncharacterized protein LOC116415882 [Nasonia vitripennis]|uniref:RNA-directed DNA polymerase n=1 Tax=Nasonia vitripennis TaxID=7425 RepID=A0A7M7T6B4_NASVI|nr:uncharacterized protein LOC116415882 [Nasonia vitripennis]
MPFGLRNSPSTFMRAMNDIFVGLQNREIFIYIDDLIIFAKTMDDHDRKMSLVVERLRESEPVLVYPDYTKHFYVTTDASQFAIGSVLSQIYGKDDKPIAFYSRILKNAETNYSTIEKELLARVDSAAQFRHALYGRRFTFMTDHKPLVWLHNLKDPTTRLKRFYFKLSEFDYNIVYKEGKTNYVADALSRNPPSLEPDGKIFVLTLASSESDEIFTPADMPSTSCRVFLFAPNSKVPIIKHTRKRNVIRSDSTKSATTPVESGHDDTNENIENETSPDDENDITALAMDNNPPELSDAAVSSINNSSDQSSEMIEPPAVTYDIMRRAKNNVIEIRDSFLIYKDNLAYFITSKNEPVCSGAQALHDANRYVHHDRVELGSVVTRTVSRKVLLALCVKKDDRVRVQVDTLDLAFSHLKDYLLEKKLKTIRFSVSQSIDDVPWITIREKLEHLSQLVPDTKFLLCKNLVRVPDEEERIDIIHTIHSSPVNGHKGVTKTYLRIRQDYYWPSLKQDIQTYISRCETCQLKKLVRQLKRRISKLQEIAQENLKSAKKRSNKYYDRKVNPCTFQVGDYVRLLAEPKKGVFGNEFSGPYKVIRIKRPK